MENATKTIDQQQDIYTQGTTKIIQNLSDEYFEKDESIKKNKKPAQAIDFDECITFLNARGQELFGDNFEIDPVDYEVTYKALVYTIRDVHNAKKHNIDLNKGLLISGVIGCGKTGLMRLLNYFNAREDRYTIKSCREVTYDFISQGYTALHKYSYQSFKTKDRLKIPRTMCFDDLGTENSLKYYGNECNVMAEILLSRYDLFIERDMITHITTNLKAQEIEDMYGDRVRSRMREMFNLISFSQNSKDKRH